MISLRQKNARKGHSADLNVDAIATLRVKRGPQDEPQTDRFLAQQALEAAAKTLARGVKHSPADDENEDL
jgi:hypothetical protein